MDKFKLEQDAFNAALTLKYVLLRDPWLKFPLMKFDYFVKTYITHSMDSGKLLSPSLIKEFVEEAFIYIQTRAKKSNLTFDASKIFSYLTLELITRMDRTQNDNVYSFCVNYFANSKSKVSMHSLLNAISDYVQMKALNNMNVSISDADVIKRRKVALIDKVSPLSLFEYSLHNDGMYDVYFDKRENRFFYDKSEKQNPLSILTLDSKAIMPFKQYLKGVDNGENTLADMFLFSTIINTKSPELLDENVEYFREQFLKNGLRNFSGVEFKERSVKKFDVREFLARGR